MKVGVIGSGVVGQVLGNGFLKHGHEVVIGTRDPAKANVSMDTLDYNTPRINEGSKGVWLGLGDAVRDLPRAFEHGGSLPAGADDPRVFCPGCLVVGGPPAATDPDAASRFAGHASFAGWPLVVVVDDPDRAAASPQSFLWTTFTRFNPGSDIHAAAKTLTDNHVAFRPPIVIDARLKPGFPAELVCDDATARTVTRRWKEYFP